MTESSRGHSQLNELADETRARLAQIMANHRKRPALIMIEGPLFSALCMTYKPLLHDNKQGTFTRNYAQEQWEYDGVKVVKSGPAGSGIKVFMYCCTWGAHG